MESPEFRGLRNYVDVSIEHLKALFVDHGLKWCKMNTLEGENSLGSIMKVCAEEYLLPNVLCPWGCSEY